MAKKPDYEYVSRAFLDRVLDSPGPTYEPRGLFLCWQEIDGEDVWTAMRNRDGEGLTEDFVKKSAAVRWLHGYVVGKDKYWTPKGGSMAGRLEKMIGRG